MEAWYLLGAGLAVSTGGSHLWFTTVFLHFYSDRTRFFFFVVWYFSSAVYNNISAFLFNNHLDFTTQFPQFGRHHSIALVPNRKNSYTHAQTISFVGKYSINTNRRLSSSNSTLIIFFCLLVVEISCVHPRVLICRKKKWKKYPSNLLGGN